MKSQKSQLKRMGVMSKNPLEAHSAATEKAQAPIIGHLVELRSRLIWVMGAMIFGTVVCFGFAEQIYSFLVAPLAGAMGPEDTGRLIYTGLTEAFFTYIKVAFFAGIFLTFPVLLIQIWRFVAPGLYKNERSAFLPFIIATPVLFFLGGAVVYGVVLPLVVDFFLGYQSTASETALPIQLEARVSEYLSLVMTMVFAFGLCFQLPVLLTLMGKAELITAGALARKRKYALIVALIAAAFLTPPDIISQIMLGTAIMLLYELSIILIRFVHKPAVTSSDT